MDRLNSTLRWCQSRAVPGMSASDSAAVITTAASAACGRSANRPGRNTIITMISAAPVTPVSCESRARALGDRGAGRAGAHREALEQAGGEVGRADADHLLVAVHLLPGALGERRRRSRSCRPARRARSPSAPASQRGDVGPADRRDRERWEALRQHPDQADAALAQPEGGADDDGEHHHDEDGGHLGPPPLQRPGSPAMPPSPTAAAAGTTSPCARPWTKPANSPIRPSASTENPNSLGSWPTRMVSGQPVHVADHGRLGEQVGDEAEPGETRRDHDRPRSSGPASRRARPPGRDPRPRRPAAGSSPRSSARARSRARARGSATGRTPRSRAGT